MKSTKVAAIVAGSLVALGAAAPAFADGLTPTSLNGGINSLAANGLRGGSPLSTNALDTENKGSLVNAVSETAQSLGKAKPAAKKQATPKHGTSKHSASKHGTPKHSAPKHNAPKHSAPKKQNAVEGVGSLLGGLPLGG